MTTNIKPALFDTFCALLCFAYLWGVVSIQHYLPSYGLYIGLFVSAILCVALALFFLLCRVKFVSYSTLLWWALALLVAIQPWLFETAYADRLLFPSGGLLLMGFLSLAVAQLDDRQRQRAAHFFALALFFAALATVASQLVQVLHIKPLMGSLVFRPNGNRLVGNVAQVNQAAFVGCMGMAAAVYFVHHYRVRHKGVWLILALLLCFLGMGLGFSASRAGLILALAALGSGVLYQGSPRRRLLPSVLFGLCVMVGYQLGTALMNHRLDVKTSAVGRMVGENSLHLRTSLLEQASMAFFQNPILGNGFDTMNHFGLQHAEEIHWFTSANHTHNLIAQMMAEFGVVGLVVLLLFAWLILKNLRLSLPHHLALAYGVLGVIALYSLSEYPLWYLKYLMVAVFFVALLDKSKIVLPINVSYPSAMTAVALFVGSVFYIGHYQAYRQMAYLVRNSKVSQDKKVAAYHNLPNVIGYKKYKELNWFLIMPIAKDKTTLQAQAKLGDRVLTQFLSASMLVKQAQILALLGESERADGLYRATCIFGSYTFCQVAIDNLCQNSAEQWHIYRPYLDRLSVWHQTHFGQPVPKPSPSVQQKIAKNPSQSPICAVQSAASGLE